MTRKGEKGDSGDHAKTNRRERPGVTLGVSTDAQSADFGGM